MLLIPALVRAVVLTGLVCAGITAHAQGAYPSKPIRLVVPYSAGGAVDALARPVAQKMSENIGQPIIVENRPGANATLGSDHVAKSPPDGHTILLSSIVHYLVPYFTRNVPYDPVADFTPIIVATIVPNILAVHPSLPVNSVQELIDYGRKNPGKLYYGSTGLGSTHHLAGIVLAQAAGVTIEHVPYKGGSPTINDVVSGALPMAILTATTVLPHSRSGRLRALAVTENHRAKIAPELPSIKETLPNYDMPDLWFGFLGPANLPAPVVQRLNAELQKVLTTSEVAARLEKLGMEIAGGTPEQAAAAVKRDVAVFRKVVDAAGIKPE
jgi:tripartite-type tricarboxylate transporter receptor subunit TctC